MRFASIPLSVRVWVIFCLTIFALVHVGLLVLTQGPEHGAIIPELVAPAPAEPTLAPTEPPATQMIEVQIEYVVAPAETPVTEAKKPAARRHILRRWR